MFFLNGTGYLNCGNTSSLQLTQGTVGAWIKTSNSIPTNRAIAVKYGAYGMYLLTGGALGVTDVCTGLPTSAGQALNDNKWHYVAFSFKSNVASGSRLYVDGSLVGSAFSYEMSPCFSTTQANQLNIGAGDTSIGIPDGFIGNIDDVAVYTQALATGDIQKIYTEGLPAHTLADK